VHDVWSAVSAVADGILAIRDQQPDGRGVPDADTGPDAPTDPAPDARAHPHADAVSHPEPHAVANTIGI
jgi:hypothetical protein